MSITKSSRCIARSLVGATTKPRKIQGYKTKRIKKCFWVWEIEIVHWEMLARTGPALSSCGWLIWPASWGRLTNGGALGWGWVFSDRGESLSCTMAVAMNRQRRRPSLHDEHTIVTFGTPAYGWGGVGLAPSPRRCFVLISPGASFAK